MFFCCRRLSGINADLLGFRLHWRGVECELQARTRFQVGNGVEGKAMRPALYDAGWGRLGVWQIV